MSADLPPFDLLGDLPTGITVLEASAGTGKTFTIAALATRYVAEGVTDLSRMLIVTFGRAATRELQDRVRDRITSTARALAQEQTADGDDDLLAHLRRASAAEVARRRQRLVQAAGNVDAATVTTTHGFCQQMLRALGTAADVDRDAAILEDPRALIEEVLADTYVARYAIPPADPTAPGAARPLTDVETARKIAKDVLSDQQAAIVGLDGAGARPGTTRSRSGSANPQTADRVALAHELRSRYDRAKRRARVLDFDDLLVRLRDALTDPTNGADAVTRLLERFDVILVDEFQDTDPVQWEILRTAFAQAKALVLIGDPKQAIYAFRGGDLETYLSAAAQASSAATLARTFRTDGDLVAAVGAVLGGAALGHPDVIARPITSALGARRLADPCPTPALRIRVLGRDGHSDDGSPPTPRTMHGPVADDVADQVIRLLGEVRLPAGTVAGPARNGRPANPGDVAVLVPTNALANLVHSRLLGRGVPAVQTGTRSVFDTQAAQDWLVLLRAVEQPHRRSLVRAAAFTPFLGWSAARLDSAGPEDLEDLATRVRNWRRVLDERGVAAMGEAIGVSGQMAERLLARPGGERDLTDLRHLGEILHTAARAGGLGAAGLVEWLRLRVAEPALDGREALTRRLESDAAAVQVMTVHGSKGLEFPVVLVPYGWDAPGLPWKPETLRFHDSSGRRSIDVAGERGPFAKEHRALAEAEVSGEALRLLYVAMTRAAHHVTLWWAASRSTARSPLHRLLMADPTPGHTPPAAPSLPSDAAVVQRIQQRMAAVGPRAVVEPVQPGVTHQWTPDAPEHPTLAVSTLDRAVDTGWARLSYSRLVQAAYDAAAGTRHPVGSVGSEPEHPGIQDEATPADVEDDATDGTGADGSLAPPTAGVPGVGPGGDNGAAAARLRAVLSPMRDLPAGTAFGTLVHEILETIDTTATDLRGELTTACRRGVHVHQAALDPDALAAGLWPALGTSLGPIAGGRRLRDIPPRDRLAELDFELPLADADGGPAGAVRTGGRAATIADIAGLLAEHLPPDDPLAGYPEALSALSDGAARAATAFRGYLTGSIDAVLRIPGEAGPTYLVADYKTNWLGEWGEDAEPLTAWDYRPEALAAAMIHHHYPLQALLYGVALHRYLRWRQPGYDPARHLGGVAYLFVRGMCGEDSPTVDGLPCGTFGWRPPAALITALSDLMDGGQA